MNSLIRKFCCFAIFFTLFSLTTTAFMAEIPQESPEEIKKLEKKKEALRAELEALEGKISVLKTESKKTPVQQSTTSQQSTSNSNNASGSSDYIYWNPNARRQTPIGPVQNTQSTSAKKVEPEKKEPVKTVSTAKPTYNPLQEAKSQITKNHFSIEGFQRILINSDLKNMIVYDPKGFTIFVPIDDAMIKGISSDRVVELLQSKQKAQFFSMFHILSNQRSMVDLKSLNGTWIDSVHGMTTYFTLVNSSEGEHLLVNGAKIIGGPFKGNNVTIYIIDSVLTP